MPPIKLYYQGEGEINVSLACPCSVPFRPVIWQGELPPPTTSRKGIHNQFHIQQMLSLSSSSSSLSRSNSISCSHQVRWGRLPRCLSTHLHSSRQHDSTWNPSSAWSSCGGDKYLAVVEQVQGNDGLVEHACNGCGHGVLGDDL